MRLSKSDRGFWSLIHGTDDKGNTIRIVKESSLAVSEGSSPFLWIGKNQHLNREEVKELVGHLQRWLETGRLGV